MSPIPEGSGPPNPRSFAEWPASIPRISREVMKDVAPASCGERRGHYTLSIGSEATYSSPTQGKRMHQFLYTFFIALTNNADNVEPGSPTAYAE